MPHFEVRSVLESGTYSDLTVNAVALIRKQRLFETRYLSVKIRYLKNRMFNSNFTNFRQKNFQLVSLFALDTRVSYGQPFS